MNKQPFNLQVFLCLSMLFLISYVNKHEMDLTI